MEPYVVSKEFIYKAHKAACPDWKVILEEEFPSLFPKGFIGKKGIPMDNSYCVHAITGKQYPGIGPAGDCTATPRQVLIISEPYTMVVGGKDKQFVTILDNNEPYRILNRFHDAIGKKPYSSCNAYPFQV